MRGYKNMSLVVSRRHFIQGLSALVAAPAVVRFESLMPVQRSLVYDNTILTFEEFERRVLEPMIVYFKKRVPFSELYQTNWPQSNRFG